MPRDVWRFLAILRRRVAGLEEPAAAANATGSSAASTATGFLSMTVSKVRAGASGVLLPPSQCLIASRLNPKVFENLAWVMPSRFRIAFTSTSCGTCALNPSRSPARKASTSFRPSIIRSNWLFMLAPVRLENTVGPFPERVALCHRQIFLLKACWQWRGKPVSQRPSAQSCCTPLDTIRQPGLTPSVIKGLGSFCGWIGCQTSRASLAAFNGTEEPNVSLFATRYTGVK